MREKEKALLTVIVPIYNIENYLRECLDSILGQTYTNMQIILVDDGATDTSPLICDEYAKKDSRVQVIHKENGGLSDARNAGLDQASGKYIAFVDGDDRIDMDAYMNLLEQIDRYQADVAFGVTKRDVRAHFENEPDNSVVLLEGSEILDAYVNPLHRPHILKAAWDKVYTRDIIGNHRFLKGKLYEDGPFNTVIMGKCQKCVFVGKVTYYYRDVRDGSISSQMITERLFTDKLPILRYQIDELRKVKREDLAWRQIYCFYEEVLKYYNLICLSGHPNQTEYLSRLRNLVKDGKREIKMLRLQGQGKTSFQWKTKLVANVPFIYEVLLRSKGK